MGFAPMTQNDFKFLESFLVVMKPIIVAMKMLESEASTYIGQVIPTVMGLEYKFKACTDPLMKPLAIAMLEGLNARFGPIKEKSEYLLATMLHPKFKLNFIPENQRLRHREILEEYMKEISQLLSTTTTRSASNTIIEEDSDDLYGFLSSKESSDTVIADQVSGYLGCKSEAVESLLAFPAVAEAFKKSNSTLPTSVSSERLFSTASQILTNRRAKMSDDVLDKLIFLRSVDRAESADKK